MKIGIDISLLCVPKTGIGQYKYNVIEAMLAMETNHEFYLYGFKYRDRFFDQLPFFQHPRCRIDVKKFPNRLISGWWSYFGWPKLEQVVDECDVYQMSETCFQPSKKPLIATIHDLTIEKFPELHLSESIFFTKRRHRKLADSDTKIIAVSEQTKADYVDYYGVDPERVKVIYHGVNKRYRPTDSAAVEGKYGLEKPYILFVGTLEPRKNLVRLVEAFWQLKEQERIPHQLVMVGKNGWGMDELDRKIRERGLEDQIVRLGYVPEVDKPSLISGADVFVYPSLYEGFGLPVLEAMACGTPVVTSDVSALPEVTGKDGSVLVDPLKVEAIAGGMWRVLEDDELRGRLQDLGMERAKEFSWERCAKETIEFLTSS